MSPAGAATSPMHFEADTRRLLVRMNSTVFHCVGAAVLLEAAAAAGDRSTVRARGREERARWLRAYAAAAWPEFSWDDACAAAAGAALSRASGDAMERRIALECAALYYRALSRVSEDGVLRHGLARMASIAESRTENQVAAPSGAWGAVQRLRSMRRYTEHMRRRVLRCVYELLQLHWTDTPPFAPTDYGEFLVRARALLAPHAEAGWMHRLAFRAWARPDPAMPAGTAAAAKHRPADPSGGRSSAARHAACPQGAWTVD